MGGWSEKPIGDVLSLEYGKPLPKDERDDDGQYFAYGANGVKCKTNKFYREGRTIIVGRKGSAGELNLTDERFWPLDVTYFVEFDREEYDLMFLYYLLSCLDLPSLARGVKPGINRNDVYSLTAGFPPLSEQKRIVAILDEAFAAIDKAIANTEKNIANAKELFDSYLNNIFTQKGDEWVEKPLGEVFHVKHGFAFKSEYFVESGAHIVLTPGSFYEGGGFRDQGKKTKYYEGPIPAGFVLDKGDLLLAMTEQAVGLLGSPLLVPESDRYLHNQRLGLVTPIELEDWCPEFFQCCFCTRQFRKHVQSSASGVKVRHTSPKKLQVIPISYPVAVEEQKHTASMIACVRAKTIEIHNIQSTRIVYLAALKQSILQKAFSGELTSDTKATDKALAEAGV